MVANLQCLQNNYHRTISMVTMKWMVTVISETLYCFCRHCKLTTIRHINKKKTKKIENSTHKSASDDEFLSHNSIVNVVISMSSRVNPIYLWRVKRNLISMQFGEKVSIVKESLPFFYFKPLLFRGDKDLFHHLKKLRINWIRVISKSKRRSIYTEADPLLLTSSRHR